MNERTLRPGNIAAAAVVMGGVLIIALPQHGLSIIRLVIVTVAAAAGLYALVLNAPATWWASPFDRKIRAGSKRHASDELDWIRSTLSGRRQRLENGPALPPEILRLLQPLIEVALEREGIDARDSAWPDSARRLLSAETWAVLTTEPLKWPPRHRTRRPDKRKTAELVHAILDELDRLGSGGLGATEHPPPDLPPLGRGDVPGARSSPRQQIDPSRPTSP